MYNNYMPPVYSDELMHFGVKGMKWGVRHDKKSGSKSSRLHQRKNAYKRRLDQEINETKKQHKKWSKQDAAEIYLRKVSADLSVKKKRIGQLYMAGLTAANIGAIAPYAASVISGNFAPALMALPVSVAMVSMASGAVFDAGMAYAFDHKDLAISELGNEYNIPGAQRRLNV